MSDQDISKSPLRDLLANNRRWAESEVERDPDFFNRLAQQASPEYLWIGCSDSRVPANELLGLAPGDVFVHRNIANVVVHSDLNCLSVLQFAIEVLKVKHVIIVGHYGCKGVHAAMTGTRFGLVDNWLRHVQDVHQKHERYMGDVLPSKKRSERLCELNVVEQVSNVQTTMPDHHRPGCVGSRPGADGARLGLRPQGRQAARPGHDRHRRPRTGAKREQPPGRVRSRYRLIAAMMSAACMSSRRA
jgi:carbonic anhydrase